MAIIGIDLGMTNSIVSCLKNGKNILIPNSLGNFFTPNIIGLNNNEILVGEMASELLLLHTETTITSIKSFIGSNKKVTLNKKLFSPEELISFILKKLKSDAESFLNESVSEAIISVPASFNSNNRASLRKAAILADINITTLINEPSLIALYRKNSDFNIDYDKTFLIFDFGGGSLDVSLVDCFDNNIDIIQTLSDNTLSGYNIDYYIAQYFCESNNISFNELSTTKQNILLKNSELCKISLSKNDSVIMNFQNDNIDYSMIFNNSLLKKIINHLFEKIPELFFKLIQESNISKENIDEILLAGGCSKMPIFKEYLETFFKKDVITFNSPDTVISNGINIYCNLNMHNRKIIINDISPITFGVKLSNTNTNSNKINNSILYPIIDKNTILPTSIVEKFSIPQDFFETTNDTDLSDNNLKKLELLIYKSNSYNNFTTDTNIYIGKIETYIPCSLSKTNNKYIFIRFTYDIDGILDIDIYNEFTEKYQNKLIVENKHLFDNKYLENKINQLNSLKIHPSKDKNNILTLMRGVSLFSKSCDEKREKVLNTTLLFEAAINTQNKRKIRKAKQYAEYIYKTIESDIYKT